MPCELYPNTIPIPITATKGIVSESLSIRCLNGRREANHEENAAAKKSEKTKKLPFGMIITRTIVVKATITFKRGFSRCIGLLRLLYLSINE